jgi:hypothetical protein
VQLKGENVKSIIQGMDIAMGVPPEFFERLEMKAKHKGFRGIQGIGREGVGASGRSPGVAGEDGADTGSDGE